MQTQNPRRLSEAVPMPLLVLSVALLICGFAAASAAAEDKPLPPAEAKNRVGQKITVELTVQASKKSVKMKKVFLDSLANFQDPDNLGITIPEAIEAELARLHATADVAGFFRTKKIRVTGTVVRRDERTYIDLDQAEQIKLVEKTP